MSKPDVILVGASVRSLAESAIRDGLVPLCVDFFGDMDLRDALLGAKVTSCRTPSVIKNHSDVPHLLETIDRSVPVILAGGAENSRALQQQLQAQRPVAGLSNQQVKTLRDPATVFPAILQAGGKVPEWKCAEDQTSNLGAATDWLLKDTGSSGGQLVSDWSSGSHIRNTQFLQHRLKGVCFSATFFATANANASSGVQVHLEGVAIQLSGLPQLNCSGYQYCGNVGGLSVSNQLAARLVTVADSLTARWSLVGFFGMDFVLHDGQPYAIEVNPRLTATHELYESPPARGHVFRQLAAYTGAVISPDETAIHSRPAIVRLVVYASESMEISHQTTSRLMRFTRPAEPAASCWLADIPVAGSVVTQGSPVCSLYTSAANFGDAHPPKSILEAIPADTSKVSTRFYHEIQAQIELVQNV